MSIPPFVTLPDSVTRTTVVTDRGRFATLHTTPAGDGPRLLLVPGFTGSKEDFIAVLPLLHEAGVVAASYDQLGQFETAGPDDERAYDLELLAADVTAVSRALWPEGPRPHLLGHSLGGLVARAAALDDPASFASLTLMCSGPSALPPNKHAELLALRAALAMVDLETIWIARQEADRAAGVTPPAPSVQEFLHLRWVRNNPHALHAKAGILLGEADRTAELAATNLPLAVLTGHNDDVWLPPVQAEMARRLGAVDVGVAEAGHSPASDQPSATAAALVGVLRALDPGSPGHGGADGGAPGQLAPGGFNRADSGYEAGMSVTSALPQDSGAAREARRIVESQLAAWGVDFVRDDLQLIASELVTNALTHADGPVSISLIAAPDHVRIEVSDRGTTAPAVRTPEDDDSHGRGMAIVEMLSRAWGTEVTDSGKTVWAEIPLTDPLG